MQRNKRLFVRSEQESEDVCRVDASILLSGDTLPDRMDLLLQGERVRIEELNYGGLG